MRQPPRATRLPASWQPQGRNACPPERRSVALRRLPPDARFLLGVGGLILEDNDVDLLHDDRAFLCGSLLLALLVLPASRATHRVDTVVVERRFVDDQRYHAGNQLEARRRQRKRRVALRRVEDIGIPERGDRLPHALPRLVRAVAASKHAATSLIDPDEDPAEPAAGSADDLDPVFLHLFAPFVGHSPPGQA